MGDGAELGAVVVGTSVGVLLHVPALRGAGFRVEALVGRDRTKAEERAAFLAVPHGFGSLEEALALPGVDVVVVATPPAAHAELVLQAVAAGKHVVCEKPFGLDLDEARRMHGAAERAGVVHALHTEFGFDSAQALFRRVVRGGEIGAPKFAIAMMQLGTLAAGDPGAPAWFDDPAQGGGWLRGAGSHQIDLVRTVVGEFASVSASVQRLSLRPGEADDSFTCVFTLASGVRGLIESSSAVLGPGALITKVVGTGGTAWIDPMTRGVFVDDGSGARRVPVPPDLVNPPPVPAPPELVTTPYEAWHQTGNEVLTSSRMYRAMRARILGEEPEGEEVLSSFTDGVTLQMIFAAIETSSAENRTVEIERF
ncbi:MAG TPA: Gfo/Idh/MocA family oxidoreductase [Acidimicrobiales bacterium]